MTTPLGRISALLEHRIRGQGGYGSGSSIGAVGAEGVGRFARCSIGWKRRFARARTLGASDRSSADSSSQQEIRNTTSCGVNLLNASQTDVPGRLCQHHEQSDRSGLDR